jgi:hypothetical protein
MDNKFLLVWSSGHTPPKPVYYREYEKGWGATYERKEAKIFRTAKSALDCYLSHLTYPEDYVKYLESKEVRAEPINQLTFSF